MNLFLTNLLLALLWAAVAGRLSPATLAAGFAVGYLVLYLARPIQDSSGYFLRLWQGAAFLGFFVRELVISSLRVAHDVITPRHRMRPGVIGIPLTARTDAEIAAFANLVSLTPGTLSLDVSADRRVLYIHAMYIDRDDVEELRRHMKDRLERRVLELLR